MFLLCRNRVADFDRWREVFEPQDPESVDSGLRLMNLWRGIDSPDQAFFLFEVLDREKAETFMASPESAEAGRISGVIDGECHFVEQV